MGGLVVIGAVVLLVWALIRYRAELAKRRGWNYQWYAREFPDLVKNGRVICYRCGASVISMERVMQHTYLRAHVCRHCGTTLYYSEEG